MKIKPVWSAIGATLASLCLASFVNATPINVGFDRVTNNNVEDLSAQLGLTIYDATDANAAFGVLSLSAGQYLFTISNNVGIASNIAEFYIDDNALNLLTFSSIVNSLGGFTDFSGPGASPANLPGGNTIGFDASAGLSVDVNPGPPSRGVDTSADLLGIIYNSTASLADIEAAILANSLVAGVHIRSIGVAGGSDSYASMAPTPISEPSALLLVGIGLGFIAVARRRF